MEVLVLKKWAVFMGTMALALCIGVGVTVFAKEKNASIVTKIAMKQGSTKKLNCKKVSKRNRKKIRWKSSDRKIVSVSSSGTIKAKRKGQATVTAKYKKKHSKKTGNIHYNVYIPKSYHGSKKYALYVTLPGYQGLYFQGVAQNIKTEDFGFEAQKYNKNMIIVAPQLNDWNQASADQTIALVEYFLEHYQIVAFAAAILLRHSNFQNNYCTFLLKKASILVQQRSLQKR